MHELVRQYSAGEQTWEAIPASGNFAFSKGAKGQQVHTRQTKTETGLPTLLTRTGGPIPHLHTCRHRLAWRRDVNAGVEQLPIRLRGPPMGHSSHPSASPTSLRRHLHAHRQQADHTMARCRGARTSAT
eukprot:157583-Chlamydomonas_euryale.AAC.4